MQANTRKLGRAITEAMMRIDAPAIAQRNQEIKNFFEAVSYGVPWPLARKRNGQRGRPRNTGNSP